LNKPYLLTPQHIDLPFDALVQLVVLLMIRNPVIFILVVVELFNRFDYYFNVWFASRINELGTVFIRVNHQVEVVGNSNKILRPNTILVCIELGFQNVETSR
jgi:hypothetical protein